MSMNWTRVDEVIGDKMECCGGESFGFVQERSEFFLFLLLVCDLGDAVPTWNLFGLLRGEEEEKPSEVYLDDLTNIACLRGVPVHDRSAHVALDVVADYTPERDEILDLLS